MEKTKELEELERKAGMPLEEMALRDLLRNLDLASKEPKHYYCYQCNHKIKQKYVFYQKKLFCDLECRTKYKEIKSKNIQSKKK